MFKKLIFILIFLTFSLTNSFAEEGAMQVMANATKKLKASGIEKSGLQVGDKIEDFSLPNAVGQMLNLYDLLTKGPVVLTFYRGGWCPVCNMQLKDLEQNLPEFESYGAELVAVSPELPDNSMTTKEKNQLSFEVLFDNHNELARRLGLVFALDESLRTIYKDYGIDIPKQNGDYSYEMPIPATFVINNDKEVVYMFKDADYQKRANNEDIIMALKNLKK